MLSWMLKKNKRGYGLTATNAMTTKIIPTNEAKGINVKLSRMLRWMLNQT